MSQASRRGKTESKGRLTAGDELVLEDGTVGDVDSAARVGDDDDRTVEGLSKSTGSAFLSPRTSSGVFRTRTTFFPNQTLEKEETTSCQS